MRYPKDIVDRVCEKATILTDVIRQGAGLEAKAAVAQTHLHGVFARGDISLSEDERREYRKQFNDYLRCTCDVETIHELFDTAMEELIEECFASYHMLTSGVEEKPD